MFKLFNIVKLVEILFKVGLVNIEINGIFCFFILVKIVLVFVICINENNVFCICVLFDVEK